MALTLSTLGRIGLLRRQEATGGLLSGAVASRGSWAPLRKALRLIVDSPEYEIGEEPPDMSYVHAGYAPLSVR